MQTVTPIDGTRTWWSEDSSGNYLIVDTVYPLESFYTNPDLTTTILCNQASTTDSGYVNTGEQSFAGVKTFTSVPICAGTATQDNELVNKALLDTTVRIQMAFKPPVDAFLLMPPALPVIGGRWIATNIGDPDFTKDYIYEYTIDGYVETPVLDGFCVVNNGDNRSYVYDSSAPAGWRFFTISLYGNAQLQTLSADSNIPATEVGAGAIKCTTGGFYCPAKSVIGETEIYSDASPQLTIKHLTGTKEMNINVSNTGATAIRSYTAPLTFGASTNGVYVDGDDFMAISNPDASTSATSGALRITGGAYFGQASTMSNLVIRNTDPSTSTSTGALIVSGGGFFGNKCMITSVNQPQLTINDPDGAFIFTIGSDAAGKVQMTTIGPEFTLRSDGTNGVVQSSVSNRFKVLKTTPATFTGPDAAMMVSGGIYSDGLCTTNVNVRSTTTPQLEVAYDATKYARVAVDALGATNISSSGVIQLTSPAKVTAIAVSQLELGYDAAKYIRFGVGNDSQTTITATGQINLSNTLSSSAEIKTTDSVRTGGIRLLTASPNSIIQSSLSQTTGTFSPINICNYNQSTPVLHSITSTGISINTTTASSNTSTGALLVAGGAGIAGDLWVGGIIHGQLPVRQEDLQIIANAKAGSGVTWTNLGLYPQIFGYEFPDTNPDKSLTFSAQLQHGTILDNSTIIIHMHVCWNVGVYNAALNTRWTLQIFASDYLGTWHDSTVQTIDIPSSTWPTAAKVYQYNLYTIPASTWSLTDSSIISGTLTRATSQTQDTDARTFLVVGFDIHYNTQT